METKGDLIDWFWFQLYKTEVIVYGNQLFLKKNIRNRMTNIDQLLLEISRMRDTFKIYDSNFSFSQSDFKQDWLNDKYQDWEPALQKVKSELEKLKKEIDEASKYTFLKESEYNGNDHFFEEGEYTYPKKLMMSGDDEDLWEGIPVIVKSRNEERVFWLKENSIRIAERLTCFFEVIDSCISEYEENKFKSPYLPKLIPSDRIPFLGNKDTFILFSYLMSKSGFFMTNSTLGVDINKTLGESWENELKDLLIQKNKFAATLSNVFYCVDHNLETRTYKTANLDTTIKGKLNEGQLSRALGGRDFFIARLRQVLKELGFEILPIDNKE